MRKSRLATPRVSTWIFVGWGLLGCANEPDNLQRDIPLAIEVRDGADQVVEGALVRVDGRDLGQSGPHGQLLVLLRGVEGQSVTVTHSCPQGYEASEPAETIVVLRRLSDSPESPVLVPIPVKLSCRALLRQVVLLVRTEPAARLPVRALGKEVARTDADGVAQVLLRGQADEEVEVALDTGEHPRLRPVSPTRRIRFSDKPQLLVFDQPFEAAAWRRRPRTRAHRPRRL